MFGARPLKRFLQRHLETRLARALIAGEITEGDVIGFEVRNDELIPIEPVASLRWLESCFAQPEQSPGPARAARRNNG